MPPRVVACPQCGSAVEWTAAATWRPFCSNRCKTIDLGAWASEAYRVPAEPQVDERPLEPSADDSRKKL